ncbi:hypothetical protein AWM75_02480 [Aerococcus urinaehominis]|uniref:D-alanyl-D-alanine carboxypeptidase-like core domain-containing protein n=1 Tax=Aerococcus urinaehominis TaxID=128944 RepID=A0A0X8FKU5_9LACT|nr:M15 family metallopeptidase [Aerococcus urinaehominis]AMB98929.1 hypothetical protein AWM75_02480 [Aerococcus urinaehominis]SDM40029.1 D-alanyl-D-alanine carboxypeptidase [Aerococcus urinaehominis]
MKKVFILSLLASFTLAACQGQEPTTAGQTSQSDQLAASQATSSPKIDLTSISEGSLTLADVSDKNGQPLTEKEILALIAALPASASLDDPDLELVNPEIPIADDQLGQLAYTEMGHLYDGRITGPYQELLAGAWADGHDLVAISAYRSNAQQAANIDSRVNSYLASGYSYDEAVAATAAYVAPAGYSEHATGLAFDLFDRAWVAAGNDLLVSYEQEPSAQWLAANAQDYGFILRFLPNKEGLTHINYEPWHFRYVGLDHAQFMAQHGLTLEEYRLLIQGRDAL